jgi:hypothetical protein
MNDKNNCKKTEIREEVYLPKEQECGICLSE